MAQNKDARIVILALLLGFLGGCRAYEINYVGQTRITEQVVKFPEAKPPDYNGSVKGENTAFHFTLENMEIEDFGNIDSLWVRVFICGQSHSDTDLLSATYFSDDIIFADKQPESQSTKSFYGVFTPRLLEEMKENAKMQKRPMCARLLYQAMWEFKKISNTVKILEIE